MNEIYVLLSSISLAGIVILGFWLYRDYRVDTLRQQLFSLRDSLFDKALSGAIDFDHPAYGLMRSTLNGVIRFAHRVSFTHALALIFIFRGVKGELSPMFNERFDNAIESLSEDQQQMMNEYKFAMSLIIARHFVLSSPLVLILVSIEAFHQVNRLVEWLKRPINQFESLALAEGEI